MQQAGCRFAGGLPDDGKHALRMAGQVRRRMRMRSACILAFAVDKSSQTIAIKPLCLANSAKSEFDPKHVSDGKRFLWCGTLLKQSSFATPVAIFEWQRAESHKALKIVAAQQ